MIIESYKSPSGKIILPYERCWYNWYGNCRFNNEICSKVCEKSITTKDALFNYGYGRE